jgi:integrase
MVHALLATHLLTGMRSAEVLGLLVGDVSLTRDVLYVRAHQQRRLKTEGSHRAVPLWPQLKDILTAWLFRHGDAPADDALLFPSPPTGGMLTDWRKSLDAVALRAGFAKGAVRTRSFRHTYCAARLQTLDNGAPVSVYTVSRELGHGSTAMVERVYSHLGQIRHRAEAVEFRLEQHAKVLADRLATMRGASNGV